MKIKTKSKFFNLINNKYKVINEQFPPAPGQPDMPPMQQQPMPPGPAAPPEPVPEPEPEVRQLTSEGEVELIRLIRKALVVNPEEGTIPPEILDEEINEENGRSILMKLKQFISTYADDPDSDY